MNQPSTLERGFLTYWKLLAKGYPEPIREFQFAPPRKFKFDFAWISGKNLPKAWNMIFVAVELEGGIWTSGRHVRSQGFIGDCDKYNLATSMGWKVFRFTSDHFRKTPSVPIRMVMETLGQ